jgi:hypothetical protein
MIIFSLWPFSGAIRHFHLRQNSTSKNISQVAGKSPKGRFLAGNIFFQWWIFQPMSMISLGWTLAEMPLQNTIHSHPPSGACPLRPRLQLPSEQWKKKIHQF